MWNRRKDKWYLAAKYWKDSYEFDSGMWGTYTPVAHFKKLRRGQTHYCDLHWNSGGPKWWNKAHHIRPLRRANKKYCKAQDWDSLPPIYGKPHEYYW